MWTTRYNSKLPVTGCRPSDVQSMLGWQGGHILEYRTMHSNDVALVSSPMISLLDIIWKYSTHLVWVDDPASRVLLAIAAQQSRDTSGAVDTVAPQIVKCCLSYIQAMCLGILFCHTVIRVAMLCYQRLLVIVYEYSSVRACCYLLLYHMNSVIPNRSALLPNEYWLRTDNVVRATVHVSDDSVIKKRLDDTDYCCNKRHL